MPIATDGPLVAGIDGSRSARTAALWAAGAASRRGMPLRLVHVYAVPLENVPSVLPPAEEIRAGFANLGQGWVSQVREAVLARFPGLVVETVVREWSAVPALVEESTGATMLVLGSRGLGGFTGPLIGSTAVAVAQRGQCPIVVVGGAWRDDDRIVVGTDGSLMSEGALGFGFDEASSRNTGLTVVRAWSEPSGRVEDDERRSVEEQVAPWRDKYPEVAVEVVLYRGRPIRALLELGKRAGLLVVGCRGRGGSEGMLLGSTSKALIAHAEGPVAVIRPAEPGENADL
ncbi:universal stress protein [Amycolatopsis keratiniphila]|nr:universal stress protein [Amycolatopsis keratiniphila]